jgi:hypothetical protein
LILGYFFISFLYASHQRGRIDLSLALLPNEQSGIVDDFHLIDVYIEEQRSILVYFSQHDLGIANEI